MAQGPDNPLLTARQKDSLDVLLRELTSYRYNIPWIENVGEIPQATPRPFITLFNRLNNKITTLSEEGLAARNQVGKLQDTISRLNTRIQELERQLRLPGNGTPVPTPDGPSVGRPNQVNNASGNGALRQARDSIVALQNELRQLQNSLNIYTDRFNRYETVINELRERRTGDSAVIDNQAKKIIELEARGKESASWWPFLFVLLALLLLVYSPFGRQLFDRLLTVEKEVSSITNLLPSVPGEITQVYICKVIDIKPHVVIADVLVDSLSNTLEIRKFESLPLKGILSEKEERAFFRLTVSTGQGLKQFAYSLASEDEQQTFMNAVKKNGDDYYNR